MKRLKLVAFAALSSLIVSCSSDGDGGGGSVDAGEYFNYTDDGTDVNITSWDAIRSEDTFEVMGTNADGTSMFFRFDAHGNLARAGSTPPMSSTEDWKNSFYEYSSNFFNFDIVAIDEVNKKIKVNYSGKLYADDFDLTSDFDEVSGSFNVEYIDVAPIVPNMHLTAKIAGNDWYSVKSVTSEFGSDDIHLQFVSDDQYQLDLNFNEPTVSEGNFTFNAASTANQVLLSIYDVETHEWVQYEGTGTLNITDIMDYSFNGKILSGTFTINATHPNTGAQVQVTNGSFKTLHLF